MFQVVFATVRTSRLLQVSSDNYRKVYKLCNAQIKALPTKFFYKSSKVNANLHANLHVGQPESRSGLYLQIEREILALATTINPKKMSKIQYNQKLDEKMKLIEALYLD